MRFQSKTTKIFFILLLLMLTAIGLFGCGQSAAVLEEREKIQVVAVSFPPYDFARQICGENADVTLLIQPGVEVHAYNPTPQDIITIQNCDVFLYGGGASDAWIDDLLDAVDLTGKQIVRMMDCVEVLNEEHVEGMEAEDDHEQNIPDEHVWTAPQNAILITKSIAAAICTADPTHEEEYQAREAAYLDQLDELDQQFIQLVNGAVRHTLVFGDRFPLRYFVEAYDLDYYAAFIGCSSETEPSAATVAFLIDKVQTENIPVVFQLELSNGNIAQAISDATGATVRTYQSCHNLTKEDFEAGATYLSLMEENLMVLKEALY